MRALRAGLLLGLFSVGACKDEREVVREDRAAPPITTGQLDLEVPAASGKTSELLPMEVRRACRVMPRDMPTQEQEAAQAIVAMGILECGSEVDDSIAGLLQAFPDSAELRFQVGNLAALRRQPKHEEAAYRRALELDERHMPSWTNLALLLLKTRRIDEAQAAIAKAQAIQRDEIVDQVAALITAFTADPNFAHLALDTYPGHSEIALALAHEFRQEGDMGMALHLAKRALELQPSNAEAQRWLELWEQTQRGWERADRQE